MPDVKDRIRELIEHSGLTNKDFAEKIDINPAIVSHILSGRNNPSLHVIQQITNVYTNVNSDYLLTGRGNLFNDNDAVKVDHTSMDNPVSYSSNEAVRTVAPPGSTPLARHIEKDSSVKQVAIDDQQKAKAGRRENPELTNVNTNVNRDEKQIERVIIFYSDKSMEEYRP